MGGTFILYHYSPTVAGAFIFFFLFTTITLVHAIQLYRIRAWFMLPVIVGGICKNFSLRWLLITSLIHHIVELTAYIFRSISHSSPQSLGPFIVQSVLALVAPALFAATIYMALGRIIRLLHAEHHSIIGVSKLTKVFVIFDILVFLIQSAGAAFQAGKSKSAIHLGQVQVLVALFLQIIVFGLFVAVAAIFQRRITSQPTQQSQGPLPWKRHMLGLYLASGLILLRNIIRIVEYVQGHDGYINHHEWYLYVFDAVPMFGVMVVMAVI